MGFGPLYLEFAFLLAGVIPEHEILQTRHTQTSMNQMNSFITEATVFGIVGIFVSLNKSLCSAVDFPEWAEVH